MESGQPNQGTPFDNAAVSRYVVPQRLDDQQYNHAITQVQRARQFLEGYENKVKTSHQRYQVEQLQKAVQDGQRAQQMLQMMRAQAQAQVQAQAQSGSNAQPIQTPPNVASVHPGWFPPQVSTTVAVDSRGNPLSSTARIDDPRLINASHASASMQNDRAFLQAGVQQPLSQFAHPQGFTQQHMNTTSYPPHSPGFPNPGQIPQGYATARTPMHQTSAVNYWETLGRITQAQHPQQQQQRQQFNFPTQPHTNQTPYHFATTSSLDNALGNALANPPFGAAHVNSAAPTNESTPVHRISESDGSQQSPRMQEIRPSHPGNNSQHVQMSGPPVASLSTAGPLARGTADSPPLTSGIVQHIDARRPKSTESHPAVPVPKSIIPSNASGNGLSHREIAARRDLVPHTLQASQPSAQPRDKFARPGPITIPPNMYANEPVRTGVSSGSPIAMHTGQQQRSSYQALHARPISDFNSGQHTPGTIHAPGPSNPIPNLSSTQSQPATNPVRRSDPSMYRPFSISNYSLPPNAEPAPRVVDKEAQQLNVQQRTSATEPAPAAPVVVALSSPETPLRIRASPSSRTPDQADMRRLAKDILRSLKRPGMQTPPRTHVLGHNPNFEPPRQSQEQALNVKHAATSPTDSQTTEVDLPVHNDPAPTTSIGTQDESLVANECQPPMRRAEAVVVTSHDTVGQHSASLPGLLHTVTQPTPHQDSLPTDGGQAMETPVIGNDGERETAWVGSSTQQPKQIVLDSYQGYSSPSHLPFPSEPTPSQLPTVRPAIHLDVPAQKFDHLSIDDNSIPNTSSYPTTFIPASFDEAPFDIGMEDPTSHLSPVPHDDQELELGATTRIEEVISSPVQLTSGRFQEVAVHEGVISPARLGPGPSQQSLIQERVRSLVGSTTGPSQGSLVYEVSSLEQPPSDHTQESPFRGESVAHNSTKIPLFLQSPTPSPEPPTLPVESNGPASDVIDLTADSPVNDHPAILSKDDSMAGTATKKYTVISSESGSIAATPSWDSVRKTNKRKRTTGTEQPFYILVPTPDWLRRKRRKTGKERTLRSDGGSRQSYDFTPEEQQVLKASQLTLRERPCLWKDCRAVMNSGNNLFNHIQECHKLTENSPKCRWQDCNQVVPLTAEGNHEHMGDHILRVMPCPVTYCSEEFSDPIDLLQHNKRHQNGDRHLFRTTNPYQPIVPTELGGIPTTMPSYQSVPRRISQRPMSRQEHERIGPMVLRNIFAPVEPKLRKQNAPMRKRASRLQYEQEESSPARPDEYDFLASLSPGPAKLSLADMDSLEVTEMCMGGLVLWRGDDLCWNGEEELNVAMVNENGTILEGPDESTDGDTIGRGANPEVIEVEGDQTFAHSTTSGETEGRNVGEEEDVALMLEP